MNQTPYANRLTHRPSSDGETVENPVLSMP